jgi:uncharacterized protein DUF6573
MRKKQKPDPIFGEIIYSYTRAQAIEDGVLVDVTQMAREAGLLHHTVVTQALWSDIKEIPKNFSYESETGRLWDVLWMARMAAGRSENLEKSRIKYQLVLHTRNVDPAYEQLIELVMDCGPGDQAEPVITIGYQEDF